jgi:hypothetical protein
MFIVALLFLMTGLAIIVYLNQYPFQPRERDYAYAGSFYAFAIWIGLGVLAITEVLQKFLRQHQAAIAATALCLLLVPVIMAKEGWDDHNRSGKYAARDFAVNYLNSCAPNAILITNGDNDTFPLWYAQEVEGIRTDVRVVNFMLASGDWYVHQMMRKIYDSERLPFTLTADQYNKGVNEIIPYYEEESIKGSQELNRIIEFIASDNQNTKLPIQTGEWINYFPTKNVRMTVDREKALKNGIVPSYMADKIEPYIEWKIKTNYMYRNDLMLLDFLATSDWERPLYFANPSSVSQVLDVETYCHLEGFVYRFMPVKAANYIKGLGGLNAEASFDILMNKCQWGNLNDPKVVIDRESNRNTMIPKQNFMRLAEALISLGRMDSAIKVADKVIELFPNEKLPFDLYMMPFMEVYYQAGAIEKGNAMNEQILKNTEENINYYRSLPDRFAGYFDEDLQQAFMILNQLSRLARDYEQNELADKIDGIIDIQLQMIQ